MAARFVLSKGRGGKYFFSLKAGNGEVILASQMYESHANALNGIASVKDNAGKDERFERLASKKGEPYFVLKAANAQIIGKSEMYASARSRNNGITSVQRNAPIAELDDRSSA